MTKRVGILKVTGYSLALLTDLIAIDPGLPKTGFRVGKTIKYLFMKILLIALAILIGGTSMSEKQNSVTGQETNIHGYKASSSSLRPDVFTLYTISGTFQVGTLTYTYTMTFNATICVICTPPYIRINSIQSLTVCLPAMNICNSVGYSRIEEDENGHMERIVFDVSGFSSDIDIQNLMNSDEFQNEIKNKLYEASQND